MKLVYLGTPEMAVVPLQELHDAGHEILLVVSGADKRRGRRGMPSPSPVKSAAIELGLEVTDDPDDLIGMDADLGVVVAYGRLLRPHLLDALKMVNLHFSLLPRWRGAAPVERALLAGDAVTGVCLMAIEEGLDTGCIYGCVEVPIDAATTAADLRVSLVEAGTELLIESLRTGLGECVPQSAEGVTTAAKLTPADLQLDWEQSATHLHRVVRVGGAWTTFRGERLKVADASPLDDGVCRDDTLDVAPGTLIVAGDGSGAPAVRCGVGALSLVRVQPAGRPTMGAGDWANGARPLGGRFADG